MAKSHLNLDKPNLFQKYSTLLNYMILIFLGRLYDFVQYTVAPALGMNLKSEGENQIQDTKRAGKIVSLQETFYHRRMFTRLEDCFNRPICSAAAGKICLTTLNAAEKTDFQSFFDELKSFSETFNKQTGKIRNEGDVLNLGSYNYLGFADEWQTICGKEVKAGLNQFGIAANSCMQEAGYNQVCKDLEDYIVSFLGKEAALVYSMGYGTNTSTLTTILTDNCLVISDSLNHSSIVNGCRGATQTKIKPFKHNDMAHLEHTLQDAIINGRNAAHEPYSKIVVVVEGIYSMEGETCSLKEIVALCKKYKAYIYLDEAHSIGALGATGRGICEYENVPTSDIDLMMGTFSKSFGGMGGYIAGTKETIDFLRANSFGTNSMSSLNPVVATQVLTAFKVINETEIGRQKIKQLRDNSNYFRHGLKKLGLLVLGDDDSPVIPVMIFQPAKLSEFSLRMLKKKVAVVAVGYPAVPLDGTRVRFCISAAHTREDLRQALYDIGELAKILKLRYARSWFG